MPVTTDFRRRKSYASKCLQVYANVPVFDIRYSYMHYVPVRNIVPYSMALLIIIFVLDNEIWVLPWSYTAAPEPPLDSALILASSALPSTILLPALSEDLYA